MMYLDISRREINSEDEPPPPIPQVDPKVLGLPSVPRTLSSLRASPQTIGVLKFAEVVGSGIVTPLSFFNSSFPIATSN
jgi:hypothetical protein